MSITADYIREILAKETLEAYRIHYKDLADNWRTLDLKAQGTIAISGIFLAGTLAFIRTAETSPLFEKILLSLVVILLAASILLALRVLIVRNVEPPPTGDILRKSRQEILNSENALDEETLTNFYNDLYGFWEKTNSDVEEKNFSKAGWLRNAHKILFCAILCASISTIAYIWRL